MAIACVNGEKRQGKSFLFLICCALAGIMPHGIDSPKNLFPAITLSLLLGIYGLKVVLMAFSKAEKSPVVFSEDQELPSVDILVSAKDEEAVIGRLVKRLTSIRYPKNKLKILIIDDGSQDRTLDILEGLKHECSNLQVICRSRASRGGKSGALNYALEKAYGEWVFILDADADFHEDILLRVVPFAQEGEWGAVQLRKAVVNSKRNLLTCCQSMEMAMDAFIQQGRQSLGGVVELRGNGALLNRKALDNCGGFNEETVTDDLDLSFRLLIAGSSIGILWDPPIHEEAVETFSALLRQRQRWAEGGLQRFFDYWPFLVSNRLNAAQHFDLGSFFLLQYALPVVSFIDLITSIFTKSFPVFWPLSFVAFSMSGLALYRGCRRRIALGPALPYPTPLNLIMSIIYLSHWFFVIPLITIKMAFMSKNLVWVKTVHSGD